MRAYRGTPKEPTLHSFTRQGTNLVKLQEGFHSLNSSTQKDKNGDQGRPNRIVIREHHTGDRHRRARV